MGFGFNPFTGKLDLVSDIDEFKKLKDTPNSYIGQANKYVTVKNDISGLEFIDSLSGLVTGPIPSDKASKTIPQTFDILEEWTDVTSLTTTITLDAIVPIYAMCVFDCESNGDCILELRVVVDGEYSPSQFVDFSTGATNRNATINFRTTNNKPIGIYEVKIQARKSEGIDGKNPTINNAFLFTEGLQAPVGPIGPQGIQGIQGLQGITGLQGIQGLIGSTGPQGITGLQGLQGVQGVQGIEGDIGPQGVQGLQGETGIQGEQGIQGIQGITGLQGIQGVEGEQGIQGSQGLQGIGIRLLGSVATVEDLPTENVTGDSWIVEFDGNLYTWDGVEWINVGQIVGPQGIQGIEGIQGVQGETGSAGVQGIQGIQGLVGEQGLTGSQGVQGIQGEIGLQGSQGITGLQGSQGLQGEQGEIGPAGEQGITGEQGVQGLQGIQGSQGVAGPTGAQGEIGPNEVTTSTATNITGILIGDGTIVSGITNNSATWNALVSFPGYGAFSDLTDYPADAAGALTNDGAGNLSWAAGGAGDMILAGIQSVTGLKTFDTTKLAVKGSSTGATAIASANDGATDYTATLQKATGTFAYLTDITGTNSGTNTGDQSSGDFSHNSLTGLNDGDDYEHLSAAQVAEIAANTLKISYTDAAAVALNTAKLTNVPTALSTGTVNGTTYGITSDGGADDVILAQATTDAAGVLSNVKWNEIVANTAAKHTQNTDTNLKSNATTGVMQITGPAAASIRVVTIPNANSTMARTDAAQTFTGVQTMTSPSITTGIVTGSTTFAAFNTTATTLSAFGAATTMTIGGTSTATKTHSYSNGATVNGATKTINFGTDGAAGSTTNINMGNAVAGTLTINSPTTTLSGTISASNLSGSNTGDNTVCTSGTATSAGVSTNLAGGSGGTIPYQSSANTTEMLANGTAGYVLQSNGTTLAPTWVEAGAGGMIYPGAGIAISTGEAWGNSITNSSANWDSAYNWGNHAEAGYLTSVTAHDLLSATHGDTTASSVARGDLIVGIGATPKWDNLAKGSNNAFLRTDGTDTIWSTGFLNITATKTLTVQNDVTISGALGTGAYATIANYATLANPTFTGTVNLPTVQLNEASIKLDATLSADEKWSGITTSGIAGATLAVGDLIYLNNDDGRWELADANLSDGYNKQLGICVLAGNDGNATEVLVFGKIRSAAFPAFTVGAPLYLSETAGDMTHTQPTTADVAIRLMGFALTAEDLMFNPSNDYITHT